MGGSGADDLVLLAVLAVRSGHVSLEAVLAALDKISTEPNRSLLTLLEEEGGLDPARRLVLEQRVSDALGAASMVLAAPEDEGCPAPETQETLEVTAGQVQAAARRFRSGEGREREEDALQQLRSPTPGRYSVRKLHGRGGQARVFMAFDEHIGREVAIKELLLGDLDARSEADEVVALKRATRVRRFLREARVTGQLDHPNITPVYELGRLEDGGLFYTMRFVRGQTLAAGLFGCEGLSDRLKLLGPFWDLCNAITFAHSRGVIHRDIKPDNVILGGYGQTVVVDWGIAKVRGQRDERAGELERRIELLQADQKTTVAGFAIGTPAYMSPEQACGKIDDIDERSDVWGLGAVLYELLTGRFPFGGIGGPEIIRNVVEQPLTPVREESPEAPAELAAIAEKALSKDPSGRYQSAADLADEIGTYMTGGRVRAYEYNSWELLRRFAARNKIAVVASALVLAVIVVALVVVSFALRAETEARVAEEQARLRELDERRAAHYHLAVAYSDKAGEMMKNLRYPSAGILAAASLVSNPVHPRGPMFHPDFASRYPQSTALWIAAASTVDRLGHLPRVRLEKSFSLSDGATDVAFSPDGCLLAAAGFDAGIRGWPLAADRSSLSLSGHTDRVYMISISPDGTTLASASRDQTLRLWDLGSGLPVRVLTGHRARVLAVRYSPDGRWLVSTDVQGGVRVWNARSGEPVRSLAGHKGRVYSADFSPDSRRVITGGADGLVRIWSTSSGEPIAALSVKEGQIKAVRYSPDGRFFVSAGSEKRVVIWDAEDLARVHTLEGFEEVVSAVAFSPDSLTLATGGNDNSVQLFEVQTGKRLLNVVGHSGFVTGLAFSPDGSRLASSSYDRTVKVWRLVQPKGLVRMSGHRAPIYSLAVSPDGRTVATGSWDRTVRLWSLADGRQLENLEGHTDLIHKVVFSRDSRRLASLSRDRSVRLWDLHQAGSFHQLGKTSVSVNAAEFSPRGDRVALASNKVVTLYEPGSNTALATLEGHTDSVEHLAFSPDGRMLASVGFDRTCRLWDLASGTTTRILRGHTDWISGVAFSPDAGRLVTGSKDGTAILWDVETGQVLRRLSGHARWINTVRFSADGRLIATASDDRSARVWSAESGQLLAILPARGEVAGIDFTPDSRALVVGDGDEAVVYAMEFGTRLADPGALLKAAEKDLGARLDGFELNLEIRDE